MTGSVYNIDLGQYGTFQLLPSQSHFRYSNDDDRIHNQNGTAIVYKTVQNFGDTISSILSQQKPYCLGIVEVKHSAGKSACYPVDALSYCVANDLNGCTVTNPSDKVGTVVRVHFAIIKSQQEGFCLFSTMSPKDGRLPVRSICRYSYNVLLGTASVDAPAEGMLEASRKELVQSTFERLRAWLNTNTKGFSSEEQLKHDKKIQNEYSWLIYWLKLSIRDFKTNKYFFPALISVYLLLDDHGAPFVVPGIPAELEKAERLWIEYNRDVKGVRV
jgi:hypothetical protein